MKLKKLDTKVVKVEEKKAKGKKIEADKLKVLKRLLKEKKVDYKKKLAASTDKGKQRSFKTKLKVVNAHLDKVVDLIKES